jgi:MFS family permease
MDKKQVVHSHKVIRSPSEDDSLIFSESYIDLSYNPESADQQGLWHKITSCLWQTADVSPIERQFLHKLDWFLLSAACAGYFIKSLNQSNIGTAYINGLKEHYDMSGNDYNILVALWTIGYVLGQLPSNMILHKLSARYYLCFLELTWAALTFSCVFVKSLKWLYLVRFLIGLTESGYFPGVQYLLGSWYSKKELTKRSTLFSCSGTAASLISGPLQQWVLQSNWSTSLKPFQWMFVLDTAISVPVALYTLLVIPDTPSTTEAFYFNRLDKLIALERRRLSGAQLNTGESFTWSKIKSMTDTWHIFMFPLLFLVLNNTGQPGTSQAFQLWMKLDLGLGSSYYNIYPSIISALGIVLALAVAHLNDIFQIHALFIYILFIATVIGTTILWIWDVPLWLHWSAYFLIGVVRGFGQPITFSWINSLLAHEDMKRNLVVVLTNMASYMVSIWVPLITFNQDDAPNFQLGFAFTTFLGITGLVIISVTRRLFQI